jgi:copper ion binding protein
MYKRFMVTQIPGLGWAGDFFINLKIHYLSGIAFVSVMIFHAIYHGWLGHEGLLPRKGDVKASILTILNMFGIGEEPKAHKYLPEQRLAYAYLGGVGLILVLTGMAKVIKNLPTIYLGPAFITWMTLIHTFATIFFLLGVLAHLAALLFKVNRPLVKSIFTGEVDLGYARDRHTVWYEDMTNRKTVEGKVEAKGDVESERKEEVSDSRRPAEVEKTETAKEEMEMASTIKVKGMSCQHCVMAVTKAISQLEGIQKVEVDLPRGEVRFENTKALAMDRVKGAIEKAGYQVEH